MEQLVSSIEGFSGWPFAEQIRFFAWYLHSVSLKPRFTVGDIRAQFEELSLTAPANPSQQLNQLVDKGDLLKDRGGFSLERAVRARLDARFGQREATVQVDKLLADLPARIPEITEREFLDEALRCFRAGAFRASLVMTWLLAYDHVCRFVLRRHLEAFNRQWPLSFQKQHEKARVQSIAKREDFSELKESDLIQVCTSAAIFTPDIGKLLKEKLDKRNSAAHPSSIGISRLQAEAFIEELVSNVVLRLT